MCNSTNGKVLSDGLLSSEGYFKCGIPYNRFGHGIRKLVIFPGLCFENKPQGKMLVAMYRFLDSAYTVYSVVRKSGLPQGYSLKDMSDDYAAAVHRMVRYPSAWPYNAL